MAHKKVPNCVEFLPAISPLAQLEHEALMQVAYLWDLVEDVTDGLRLQHAPLMSLKRLHVHLHWREYQGSVSLQHITARMMHVRADTTHLNNRLQCLEVGPFCVKDPLDHQLSILILSTR